jgi:hypothetical protein
VTALRRSLAALALLAVVASCGVAPAPLHVAPSAPAAPTAPTLDVTYRDAANVFEILDNVSVWWRGKADPEYRKYWEQRYGLTEADQHRFASYKEIRKRYFSHEDDPDGGLFAPAKAPDRIAETFYDVETLEQAFAKLAAFVTTEDVATLRSFYEAYRTQLAPLLEESRAYVAIAKEVAAKLTAARTADYYASLARYYGTSATTRFTVLYIWWPPVDNVRANQRGKYLLLKYNPLEHRTQAERAMDVTVHELAHFVSSRQPEAQKQALTKTFLAGCDVPDTDQGPRILEEPLAVVHQKIYLGQIDPARLEFKSPWYGHDAWVSDLAKASYEDVRASHAQSGHIDDALMTAMAKRCAQLLATGAYFRSAQ